MARPQDNRHQADHHANPPEWQTFKVHDPTSCVLRDFDDLDLLWDFNVWESHTLTPPFLLEYFIPKIRIVHHASLSFDDGIHFGHPSTLCCFLPTLKVRDLLMLVSFRSMNIRYFGSSDFGSFILSPLAFS
jgi:hypothetical protein